MLHFSSIFKSLVQILEEKKGGTACVLYSIILSKGFYEYDISVSVSVQLLKILFSLKYEMQDNSNSPLIDSSGKVINKPRLLNLFLSTILCVR